MRRKLINFIEGFYKQKKKMSIIQSNCQEICNSPTNNSKSKMLYSFSKGQRFPRAPKIICDRFYDINSSNSMRSTSFGFGQKYDLSKTSRCSPPMNSYNIKSQFDPSKTERKGFGFGKGRQEMQATGPLMMTLRNRNPGPGTYPLPSTLQKTSYSFLGKKEKIDKEKLMVPGPGHYPVCLGTSEKGKYSHSKIKNVLVRNFSTMLGRKQRLQNRNPAPGAYDISRTNLSPEGKYYLSRMQNSRARKFGNSMRTTLADKKLTPGPGNYKLPSQFGHYVSSKFQESLKKAHTQNSQKENIPQ